MNRWVVSWQKRFPPAWCGVRVEGRVAPVRLPTGVVIDLRYHSPNYAEVRKREAFFEQRMVWVFDASEAREHERLVLYRAGDGRLRRFRWDDPRRIVMQCRCRVYLDVGYGWLLEVRQMAWGEKSEHREWGGKPLVGNGVLVSADEFVSRALQSCGVPS